MISSISGAYMVGVEHYHPTLGSVSDLYTSDKPENNFLLSLRNIPTYISHYCIYLSSGLPDSKLTGFNLQGALTSPTPFSTIRIPATLN